MEALRASSSKGEERKTKNEERRTKNEERGTAKRLPRVAFAAFVLLAAAAAAAQPDPRQMSGLPLPVAELPDGTITVRVIRGALSNNVPGQPVELWQGDSSVTVNTDAEGRATFLTLNPGSEVYAVTELDGERLESQRFAVPGRGGVRLMLVGVGDAPPMAPAEAGRVTFGGESRVIVELTEESVELYYVFDVVNLGDAPVEPREPIVFDLPAGAVSTTFLQDSSPRTRIEGRRVELPGPFAPGTTPLRVAYIMPYTGGSLGITQVMPADLEAFFVMVEKWGEMDIASPLVERRMEDELGERTYIFGAGPRVTQGSAFSFELSGLPHHSRVPGTLAIVVGLVILGVGGWGAATPVTDRALAGERRSVETRREKLYASLVKNERQHGAGKIGATKYGSRRREIVTALEQVLRALDESGAHAGSEPRARA